MKADYDVMKTLPKEDAREILAAASGTDVRIVDMPDGSYCAFAIVPGVAVLMFDGVVNCTTNDPDLFVLKTEEEIIDFVKTELSVALTPSFAALRDALDSINAVFNTAHEMWQLCQAHKVRA